MIIETVRIWKEDTSEEFEAKTSFFIKDIINVEEYTYHANFKNDSPKSFVHLREIGSIIVIEEYESLKKRWVDYFKFSTVSLSN